MHNSLYGVVFVVLVPVVGVVIFVVLDGVDVAPVTALDDVEGTVDVSVVLVIECGVVDVPVDCEDAINAWINVSSVHKLIKSVCRRMLTLCLQTVC